MFHPRGVTLSNRHVVRIEIMPSRPRVHDVRVHAVYRGIAPSVGPVEWRPSRHWYEAWIDPIRTLAAWIAHI